MGMMAAGAAQVRMFSDDGICVHDPLVMRRALEYATGLGVLIAQHAEEPRLTVGARRPRGPNAARLGLSGWPRAAEESIVARDALLARDAGARVHICHASTAGTVEILKWAKDTRDFDHRRGHPASPVARRRAGWPATTGATASTRRCAKPPTRWRCARRWPTVSSTVWPPTMPRTPSTRSVWSSPRRARHAGLADGAVGRGADHGRRRGC